MAVVTSALGYSGLISLYNIMYANHYVLTTKMMPQVWRIFTAFLITKPKFAILLDPYFLYQYGSAIERDSSRFSRPGDFFIYTVFVGSAIVVSAMHASQHVFCIVPVQIASTLLSAIYGLLRPPPRIICPPSQRFLAEAVPGTEGEYPCTSCSPVIRIIKKGLCGV